MNHVVAVVRSPWSLACLLEAAGPLAVERCGVLLERWVAEGGAGLQDRLRGRRLRESDRRLRELCHRLRGASRRLRSSCRRLRGAGLRLWFSGRRLR